MFVPPDSFEAHTSRLRRVVPLGDEGVSITFDDAYASFFEAFEVLQGRGLPVTLFVPSGKLGGRNDWDASTSCDTRLMTRAQVAELAARGVEIASHGHMHVDLTKVPGGEARADLTASVETLAEITGRRPRFLAYPWGRHNRAVRALAAEAGFEAAYAVNAPSGDRFGIERVQIEPSDSRLRFALKTSGAYGLLRRYKRTLTSTKSASSSST